MSELRECLWDGGRAWQQRGDATEIWRCLGREYPLSMPLVQEPSCSTLLWGSLGAFCPSNSPLEGESRPGRRGLLQGEPPGDAVLQEVG